MCFLPKKSVSSESQSKIVSVFGLGNEPEDQTVAVLLDMSLKGAGGFSFL